MSSRMKSVSATFAVLALVALVSLVVRAQQQQKRASPHDTAEVTLGGKKVSISYGRPYVKGRQIFGGLVPYDKIWRTGANEATLLTTEADLTIGGTTVPAGKYSLFTIPGQNQWKLVINRQSGQWGTEYDSGQDLARVDMQVSRTAQPVEQFTISFDQQNETSATLHLAWADTQASVPVSVK